MRTLRVYKSYNFRGKEPCIDQLRTLIQDEFGRLDGKALRAIEEAGGPTTSCQKAWFFGKTKRPQNITIEAAGRAIGYRREWVKMNGRKKP